MIRPGRERACPGADNRPGMFPAYVWQASPLQKQGIGFCLSSFDFREILFTARVSVTMEGSMRGPAACPEREIDRRLRTAGFFLCPQPGPYRPAAV